jgi:hypothetical protein
LAYTHPALFTVSELAITPAQVDIGEEVTISALVSNSGDCSGSCEVVLEVDDVIKATQQVTLAGCTSQRVTFTTASDVAGTCMVRVNGLPGTFLVKAPPALPKPAAFTASALAISPAEVEIGETVTISASVANTGELEGTYGVILKIDGAVAAIKDVTLAGGSSQDVTFTISKDAAKTYEVRIDSMTGTFTVKPKPLPAPVTTPEPITPVTPTPSLPAAEPTTNWALIGGIIGVVVVLALVASLIILRRSKQRA